MRTRTRTATTLAAIAMAPAMLVLVGCSSAEDPAASSPATSASESPSPSAEPDPSTDPSGAPEITPGATAETLAGTSWFGTAEGVAEVTLTFAADGTVDFASFNGQAYDEPGDTWSVDGTTLTLTMSQLQSPSGAFVDIVFTGTAATGGMELTGTDGTGASYAMTIVQL